MWKTSVLDNLRARGRRKRGRRRGRLECSRARWEDREVGVVRRTQFTENFRAHPLLRMRNLLERRSVLTRLGAFRKRVAEEWRRRMKRRNEEGMREIVR